ERRLAGSRGREDEGLGSRIPGGPDDAARGALRIPVGGVVEGPRGGGDGGKAALRPIRAEPGARTDGAPGLLRRREQSAILGRGATGGEYDRGRHDADSVAQPRLLPKRGSSPGCSRPTPTTSHGSPITDTSPARGCPTRGKKARSRRRSSTMSSGAVATVAAGLPAACRRSTRCSGGRSPAPAATS